MITLVGYYVFVKKEGVNENKSKWRYLLSK